jgi:hypothetical protein
MHGHGHGGGKGIPKLTLQNIGSVNKAYAAQGWSMVGRKLRCAECEQKRKSSFRWFDTEAALDKLQEKEAMTTKTNVAPIRQPTPEQRRQIFEMLTACYDLTAKRYTGKETDVTIADTIGGGCMFGWVAEIREAMFGPDGGNEEHEALMADLAQWRANADKLAEEMASSLREFNDARAKVKDLQSRLDAVVKAAGPKVRTA